VLGGTFDPPHIGHLIVACEARWQLGLDEVRLVPARHPPHKDRDAVAPVERRAAWLEEAVAGRVGLVVSRCEIAREGPSYTADTLAAMAAAADPVSPRATTARRAWRRMRAGSCQPGKPASWSAPRTNHRRAPGSAAAIAARVSAV
jgi:cytidyltransferase-like protein